MPTWYRALSAPAANRPAHGTPQQAPGGGTAAHASSRHLSSPSSMRTPHSQHTSPRARIQQAPRGGEQVARDSVFGRSGSKVRTTRFPLPPKTAQASRRTLQASTFCSHFRPFQNRMTLACRQTPFANSHIAPKRHSWAAPLSRFATFRHPARTTPQPTARRPVHGSETAAHASGDRPVRGRRAPDAPHFAPMLRVSGVMRTECPRACRFPGLREIPNSHNPEYSHTPSPHADSGKLSPRYIPHSLTRNLFHCRRFHASTSNAGIVGPLGIQ